MKKLFLPLALMGVFALSRLPGCLPDNFSAAYALMFCAGVYLPGRLAWWLPLSVMLVTDLVINLYYQQSMGISVLGGTALVCLGANYVAYAALIGLGRRFNARDRLLPLLGGGLLGAILFYFLTNTAAWLFNPFHNPEYTRTLSGWFIALTKGTAGYPHTWEFFRNTMLSGGLFTGLFVGSMKLNEAMVGEDEKQPEAEPAGEDAAGEQAHA
jgi:hypothetical protein